MNYDRADIFKLIMLFLGTCCLGVLLWRVSGSDMFSYDTARLLGGAALFFAVSIPLLAVRFREIKWGTVDLVLLGLILLYVLSSYQSGCGVSSVALQEMFPYCLIYIATKAFSSVYGKCYRRILFACLCLWLISESFIGLSQIFGYRSSGHVAFGMTGSFFNPGPYGGFITIILTMAVIHALKHHDVWKTPFYTITTKRFILLGVSAISIIAGICGILVLPASMSRAAWIGFAVSLILYLHKETNLLKRLYNNRLYFTLTILGAIILGGCMIMLKADSAIGRLQIWHMELRAILDNSLIGNGPGRALGAYGLAQGEYFKNSGDTASKFVQVAGCPEYAFNEFLKIGMETGVAGLLLGIAAMLLAVRALIRSRSIFAYGLTAAIIFACFSYPLSVAQLAVLTVLITAIAGSTEAPGAKHINLALSTLCIIVLSAGIIGLHDKYKSREEAYKAWKSSRQWATFNLHEDSVKELGPLYDDMSWNYRYLYDYGYALYKTGEYARSNQILEIGAYLSSDPMFHNIMGRNYEEMKMYPEAGKEYMTSHYMVPCRLYPLVLLMEMYHSIGENAKAADIGRKILSMPVNPRNRTMVNLRIEVEETLETIEEQ